jgi:hypothetical protein
MAFIEFYRPQLHTSNTNMVPIMSIDGIRNLLTFRDFNGKYYGSLPTALTIIYQTSFLH